MKTLISLTFCLVLGIAMAKQGVSALLWFPISFFVSLFLYSNLVLPIILGLPQAFKLVTTGVMRGGVFLALLVTPLVWSTLLVVVSVAWPSSVDYFLGNVGLSWGSALGFLSVLSTPFSKQDRSAFVDDFTHSYKRFFRQPVQSQVAPNNRALDLREPCSPANESNLLNITQELDQASRDLAKRYNDFGLDCLRQGRSSDAIPYFQEALSSLADAEDNHEANLKRLEAALSPVSEASTHLKEIRELVCGLMEKRRLDYARVSYNLATALRNLQLNHEALDTLKFALDLQPDSPLFHYALALQLDMVGDHQKVLAEVQELEALGQSQLAASVVEHLADRAGYDPVFENPDFPVDSEYWQLRAKVVEKLLAIAEVDLQWHAFL
jgi:hypothetical protein